MIHVNGKKKSLEDRDYICLVTSDPTSQKSGSSVWIRYVGYILHGGTTITRGLSGAAQNGWFELCSNIKKWPRDQTAEYASYAHAVTATQWAQALAAEQKESEQQASDSDSDSDSEEEPESDSE